jgi:hypothetical protein
MSGYIWYSTGSDVSGPKLAEALDFTHGKKTPKLDGVQVLIGWGCKSETRERYDPKAISAAVADGHLRVVNYPAAITAARNKMGLLQQLHAAGIVVPGFVSVKDQSPTAVVDYLGKMVDDGSMTLPCVGYNEFHKGKPVFCWTKEDLEQVVAINKSRKKDAIKIHYFRSLLQGTEYRVHVFRDEALCADVKKLSKDPVEATAKSLFGRLTKRASKSEKALSTTEEELRWVVDELVSDLHQGPSHLQKSVQYGWELEPVDMGTIPAEVISTAINALDAAGLDMGAVSVVQEENSAVVTNIISAPALDDAQLQFYTEAIKDFAGADSSEKKEKAAEEVATDAASNEIIARLTRRVRLGKISQVKAEEMLKALE